MSPVKELKSAVDVSKDYTDQKLIDRVEGYVAEGYQVTYTDINGDKVQVIITDKRRMDHVEHGPDIFYGARIFINDEQYREYDRWDLYELASRNPHLVGSFRNLLKQKASGAKMAGHFMILRSL